MLLEVMSEAEKNNLIGPESRLMMEGVLRISEMRALDIMVAGPRIDMIDIEMERDELFHQVIDIGHSRYPVFEESQPRSKKSRPLGNKEVMTYCS